ncbi:MAG TPA: hypothetical protein VHS32_34485, partial [Streptosporangiaceae bacterium]|nr:hypothetical protein [Streptosporangiaceae bacterium]
MALLPFGFTPTSLAAALSRGRLTALGTRGCGRRPAIWLSAAPLALCLRRGGRGLGLLGGVLRTAMLARRRRRRRGSRRRLLGPGELLLMAAPALRRRSSGPLRSLNRRWARFGRRQLDSVGLAVRMASTSQVRRARPFNLRLWRRLALHAAIVGSRPARFRRRQLQPICLAAC